MKQPFLLLALFACLPVCGFADPLATASAPTSLRLPAIIGDHMVLQADTADPIWGWARPHADISVQFVDDQGTPLVHAAATADGDGRWSAKLPVLKAGLSGKLTVGDGTEIKEIKDVLTGQTWLCGGQSNMAYVTAAVVDAKRVIAEANDPMLRLFSVRAQPEMVPRNDIPAGEWVVCTPQTVPGFSAVGYFFGKHLRSSLGQPVGLIGSYWSGTKAQVWTSIAALRQVPALQEYVGEYEKAVAAYPGGNDQFSKEYDAYMKTMDAWRENVKEDKGFQTALAAWRKEDDAAQAEHKPEPPRPPFPSPTPAEPHGRSAGNPSFLFNGMIAPLVPFGLRGVIWFQADGNMGHPQDYGLLIKTLINDWRAQWKRELPFYYIEMNNMDDYPQKDPVQVNKLSLIREQQQAALELPGTGVVCSIDVGLPVPEPHFPNKKPVGDRLALLALNDLYNQKGLVRSPAYKDFRIEGDKVRIHFTDADGLRIIPGHPFAGFAIKGGTGDWVWAQGRIEGNSALVWSDKVPQPVAVRYAWAMNPVISIENGAGLPLRPFRTDTESTQ